MAVMQYNLQALFLFSGDVSTLGAEITGFLSQMQQRLLIKNGEKIGSIDQHTVQTTSLMLTISSVGQLRPHNLLLQMKNMFAQEFGRKHHLGIREIRVTQYTIQFELDKEPKNPITVPFAEVHFSNKTVTLLVREVSDEFLQNNYIDRIISRVREKVDEQYYAGKAEYWKLIWGSAEKKMVWSSDPTEEMVKQGWIQSGPTKGKWFYRPEATAILKTMETIAFEEVLRPLGFQEVIESHIVPFDIWLKTGHMEGMPAEFYYVVEPVSRDVKQWERFVDLVKITKEVPVDELQKNVVAPSAGICYAQCPMIYWSFKGKTIAESSLPVLVFDNTAISCRYESGGRHGIERVDEFHRIEPVYIGTRSQLMVLRDKMLERYKHVFNDIFDLEWRMAWVTPWYMQQAGKHGEGAEQDTGTIDFEAYMPYRGDRESSEWLEFQNLSILGDKYVKAFNIKTQKSELWSGCSGIGLERWTTAFLAQKGLDPKNWPEGFQKYLDRVPEGIRFL